MTEARITYSHFVNAYQLARITSLIEGLRPMFPTWAETVTVERFDRYDEKDQSTLSVDLNCAYLNFRLEVYNNFWQVPEEKQREKIIHELVHALHADVITFDRDSLIDYAKAHNPDLGAYLFREHEQRVEKFTQAMAFAFERMIAATEAKCNQGPVVFGPSASPLEEFRVKPTPGVSRDILKDMERIQKTPCGQCNGPIGEHPRNGPTSILCVSCWDAKYQHGNGAEPAKPYSGVSTIASKGTP